MRRLIFLSFILLAAICATAQTPPNKAQIMSKMNEANNVMTKQIAEKEKELADARQSDARPQVIRQLEDDLTMLKEKAKMMRGLTGSISQMSNKIIKDAGNQHNGTPVAPKKDLSRIKLIPKNKLTDAELPSYIRTVNAGVEKLISVVEKTEAINIYSEVKTKYKTTAIVANAGTGCWMLGHWEKALIIMGKACAEEIENADNLNNYAAFLVMTGGEQAAIPILNYLNAKYPNNSTILNNLGQAWFGLGEMNTAKKFLDSAISIYPNHSQANYTAASIVLTLADSMKGFDPPIASHPMPHGDSLKSFDLPASSFPMPLSDSLKSFSPLGGLSRPVSAVEMKAINFLKASLKGNYDPRKEADLAKLGYTTTYSDLPPFNYPMQEDPFNLIQLIKLIPQKLQTNLNDPAPAHAGQEFINGVEEFYNELTEEDADLEKQVQERRSKLITNLPYQQGFLEGHNCPAHLLAARSVMLLNLEYAQSSSPFPTQLWMPYKKITGNQEIPLPPEILVQQCIEVWDKQVREPIVNLTLTLDKDLMAANGDCKSMDAIYVAFLEQRAKIYNAGVDLIRNEFIKKSKRLRFWITRQLYAMEDEPPEKIDDYTYALVGHLPAFVAKEKYANELYETTVHLMELGKEYYNDYASECKDKNNLDRLVGKQNIKKYKVVKLPCQYQKKIITPVYYVFELKCNTKVEKSTKLKKRNPNTKKGAVELSSANNAGSGPLQAHGPAIFYNSEIDRPSFAPLCLEDKTPSQCTLEYSRSGNLVGLNFQLNEDGTGLKDPGSVESGVDSRWSWNAIGSSTKSYMYKLLMK